MSCASQREYQEGCAAGKRYRHTPESNSTVAALSESSSVASSPQGKLRVKFKLRQHTSSAMSGHDLAVPHTASRRGGQMATRRPGRPPLRLAGTDPRKRTNSNLMPARDLHLHSTYPSHPALLLHKGSQYDSSTPMTRRVRLAPMQVSSRLHQPFVAQAEGTQGSWALWALTFYNPNSVYHHGSDDTWRDSWLVRKQHICVSRGGT